MPVQVTLHVDLVWTDLEDFAEHFERAFFVRSWLLGDEFQHAELIWSNAPRAKHPMPEHPYVIIRQFERRTTREWDAGYSDGAPSPEKALFLLTAMRYRRDRLKLLMHEPNETYAPRLRKWLHQRWGEDGVTDRPVSDAPPMHDPSPRVPGRSADRTKWIATWRAIRGEVEKGNVLPKDLLGHLAKSESTDHLRWSEDTMRDIIRAGLAGLLEETPNNSH
jgi:hypothetical protein